MKYWLCLLLKSGSILLLGMILGDVFVDLCIWCVLLKWFWGNIISWVVYYTVGGGTFGTFCMV